MYSKSIKNIKKYMGIINGAIIGDIMGVPFEFSKKNVSGEVLITKPFNIGGMHDQPLYSWSDDTSMLLATMKSLNLRFKTGGPYDIKIMKEFVEFYKGAKYTSHNVVFDYGITTRKSIDHFINTGKLITMDDCDEDELGNGSIMRIAPALIMNNPLEMAGTLAKLTHYNTTSIIICKMFVAMLLRLSRRINGFVLGHETSILKSVIVSEIESVIKEFKPKLNDSYRHLIPDSIDELITKYKDKPGEPYSTGFVIDTLIVAIYCVITTDTFKDSIYKAINLAGDTDTNAAVTGMLAGAVYGIEGIPDELLAPIWSDNMTVSHDARLIMVDSIYKETLITDEAMDLITNIIRRGNRGWTKVR